MKNGFGSPYVKLFTSKGEITAKVTDFVYLYSQEKDDICQLRIEELNPNLPDDPGLQEGVILTVTWGYQGESDKMTRQVVIMDTKPHFSSTMVTLDLLCKDKASRMKNTSSKKVHSGTLLDIAKSICDKHDVKVVDATESGEVTLIRTETREPDRYKFDGNYQSAKDNTIFAKPIILRTQVALPQANKSDYQVIREAADNDPNGPFETYGRDGEFVISKMDLNQAPIRKYTYGDEEGKLLDFTPETKNSTRKAGASNINTTAFDPKKKTAYDMNVNGFTNPDTKLGDSLDLPPRADQAAEFLGTKDSIELNGDNEEVNSEAPIEGKVTVENADTSDNQVTEKKDFGILTYNILNTNSPSFVGFNGVTTAAVDKTTTVIPLGSVPVDWHRIDYNEHVPSSEHSIEDAYAKAKNLQALNELDISPASAELMGDPLLISGKVLSFMNVSKKYSGNYYVVECEHKINRGSGYRVTTKMRKNGLGITPGSAPSKVKVTTPVNKKLSVDTKNNNALYKEVTKSFYSDKHKKTKK